MPDDAELQDFREGINCTAVWNEWVAGD